MRKLRKKATFAVALAAVAALLLFLALATPAGAAGAVITIPAGDVATLSDAHWGGPDQCPVDNLAYGYALDGGSNVQVATGNGCNAAAGATIGPVATSTTLTIYLTDGSCSGSPTYYSDGTPVDHALVQAGTGTWEVSLMDCDGNPNSGTREPTEIGDGNVNVTITLSSPPQYQSGASLTGTAQQGSTLTAKPGVWTGTPAPTFSYDWKRCNSDSCTDITSGPVTTGDTSSSSYQLTGDDVGDTIEVVISGSNGVSGGSSPVTVGPSATVVPPVPGVETAPSVPGTPQQGVPVTADEGTWSNSPTSYDFLWLSCNSTCGTATGSGATTQTYTPDAADVGNTLEVQVTAHNAGGPGMATSAPSATVVPPAPTVTTAPSVPGTPEQGVPVTADEGMWSNSPTSYDFLWLSCDTSCGTATGSGATTQNYTPDAADVGNTLEVQVTAHNAGGQGVATSGPSATVVPPVPGVETAPSVPGTPQQGVPVTADEGTWSNSPTSYDFLWLSCDPTCATATGSGATTQTYTPNSADVGNTLEVQVTAHNAGGPGVATSGPSATVVPPNPTVETAPSVPGTPQQGVPVTADEGTWSNSPTSYDFLWLTCNPTCSTAKGSGAATQTYTPDAADVGNTLEVQVTAHNAGGPGMATSGPSATVVPPVPGVETGPSVPGTPQQGVAVTANEGTWSNSPTSYDFLWLSCNPTCGTATGSGAATQTYTPDAADVGNTLEVQVTAHNAGGPGVATSGPSATVVPPNPTQVTAPSIPGTPQQGVVVTANPGTWSNSPTSYDFLWLSCDSTCGTATGSGATTQNYTPDAADVGNTLEVQVTAHNAGGPGMATSGPSATVVPPNPVVQTAPSIPGTPQQGVAVTTSNGTWSNNPTSFTYQWLRCNPTCGTATGSGATTQSYTPDAADVGNTLEVTVTAHNAGGPGSSTSQPSATVVPPNPTVQTAPSVPGTPQQGVTVTGNPGTWSNSPTSFTYLWLSCNPTCATATGTGATTQIYTPDAADVGNTLEVQVTAHNAGGPGVATSAPSAAVLPPPPANNAAPTITGGSTAQSGVKLTATNGTWTQSPTSFTYQWSSCTNGSISSCTAIAANSTSQTYTPTPTDAGSFLIVTVTAHNSGGATPANSAETAAVLPPAPNNTVQPQITGTAQPGQTLSVSNGTWNPLPSSFAYQWQQCDASGNGCTNIQSNAQGQTYMPTTGDIGHELVAIVTAKGTGGSSSVPSTPSEAVSVAPPSNSGLPSIPGTPQQGQPLTPDNGSWNNSPDNFSYQWERCDASGNGCSDEPTGGTGANYVPTPGDVGETLRVIVTAGNASGKTPATSAASAVVLIAAPAISVLPQITGTAQQGQPLSVSTGTWDNSPTDYVYGWWQCDAAGNNCASIGNPTNGYTPVIGDVGHTLRASVEASNNGGHTTVMSGPTAVVAGLQASAPPPIFQQSADLAPVTGSVFIKLPGSNTFTPVTGPIDVPDGAIINATQGTVSLTVQLPKGGGYETGKFYSGEFKVNQAHSGTLLATLAGGNFNVCTATNGTRQAHAAKSSPKKKSKTVVRKLWGNAHGNYTTKGRYGSASVSGTIWLTEDTCSGTYFYALKDNVIVVSFAHPNQKHNVKQGQSFFIPAP